MFFEKKLKAIKWNLRNQSPVIGSVVVQTIALKLHEKVKSEVRNDPAGSDYIPLAVELEGDLIKAEGVSIEPQKVLVLLPYSALEDYRDKFLPGDMIRLWLSDERRCVRFEKVLD